MKCLHSLIILLIIILGASFFFWHNTQESSSQEVINNPSNAQGATKTPEAEEIAWQTFTSDGKKFTISYADFSDNVTQEPNKELYLFPFGGKDKLYPNEVYLFSVSIDDHDNPLYDTNDYLGIKPEPYTSPTAQQVKIFRMPGEGCTKPVCGSSTFAYRITQDSTDYTIVIAGTISEDHPIAQKILSSFKVLN